MIPVHKLGHTKYKEARQQIAKVSTKQSQAMDEQKQYLKHAIQNDIQQFVAQSISQQFHLMQAQGQISSSPSQSPARKQQKPTSGSSSSESITPELLQANHTVPTNPPHLLESDGSDTSASRSPRPSTGLAL